MATQIQEAFAGLIELKFAAPLPNGKSVPPMVLTLQSDNEQELRNVTGAIVDMLEHGQFRVVPTLVHRRMTVEETPLVTQQVMVPGVGAGVILPGS